MPMLMKKKHKLQGERGALCPKATHVPKEGRLGVGIRGVGRRRRWGPRRRPWSPASVDAGGDGGQSAAEEGGARGVPHHDVPLPVEVHRRRVALLQLLLQDALRQDVLRGLGRKSEGLEGIQLGGGLKIVSKLYM